MEGRVGESDKSSDKADGEGDLGDGECREAISGDPCPVSCGGEGDL